MDIAAVVGLIGTILGAVGTLFGISLNFALNAAKQQLAVLQVAIDTLQEDRDYYRTELRNNEKASNERIAAVEARYEQLRVATEAEREANHNAIEGFNETVAQLKEQLRISTTKNLDLEKQLDAAKDYINQIEAQRASERDSFQAQIRELQDNLAKLLPSANIDANADDSLAEPVIGTGD